MQAVLIAMSMVVTTISARSLQMKKGLPLPSQIAGWVLFCESVLSSHGRRLLMTVICSHLICDPVSEGKPIETATAHSPHRDTRLRLCSSVYHPVDLVRNALLLLLLRRSVRLVGDRDEAVRLPTTSVPDIADECRNCLCRRQQGEDEGRCERNLEESRAGPLSHLSNLSILHSRRVLRHWQHRLDIILLPRTRLPPGTGFQSIPHGGPSRL